MNNVPKLCHWHIVCKSIVAHVRVKAGFVCLMVPKRKKQTGFHVKLIAKIKALRANKRQVWPGKEIKQRAWSGMEPASVFCVLEIGQDKNGRAKWNLVGNCVMKLNRASLAQRCNPAYKLNKLT